MHFKFSLSRIILFTIIFILLLPSTIDFISSMFPGWHINLGGLNWLIIALVFVGLFIREKPSSDNLKKEKQSDLYPEITKAGSLKKALQLEFKKIQPELKVEDEENGAVKLPFSYARVGKNKRFSQIYIAAESKCYLPDFWRQGVCLAHGKINDISLLAQSIHTWINTDITTSELAKQFTFIVPEKKAIAFDEGSEVPYKWNVLLEDETLSKLKPLVKLAKNHPKIGQLFPYTSLSRLCLSRCTGYPYMNVGPIVVSLSDNDYHVVSPTGEPIGRGNAADAISIIEANLPSDIQPAVKGTAEDL